MDWCYLLPIAKYEPSQGRCIEDIATITNDRSLCSQAGDVANGFCAIDKVLGTGDITLCYTTLTGDYSLRCIQQIAKDDPSLCDKLLFKGPYAPDACRDLLAPDAVQY